METRNGEAELKEKNKEKKGKKNITTHWNNCSIRDKDVKKVEPK